MANKNPKTAVDGIGFTNRFIQQNPVSSSSQYVTAALMPVEEKEEYYNMNHPNRGIALIFDHENFGVGNFKKRTGTAVDCNNLKEQLKHLSFDVRIFKDSKYNDLMEVVDDVVELDHSKNDCFLMAILTHGGDSDILYAFDRQYKLDELWSKFTADRCPSLAGKPKLFLVQACRGEKLDKGIALTRSCIQVDGDPRQSYRIPIYADFLIAYSTVSGYYSFRDTAHGSWYMQAFCEELKCNGKKLDFQRILTRVARRVAIDYECNDSNLTLNFTQLKQMPSVISMLTRLILFSDKN